MSQSTTPRPVPGLLAQYGHRGGPTAQEARTRSTGTSRDIVRRFENRSGGRGSSAQYRRGTRSGAAKHTRVLPALRLEGSTGVGRVPGNGARRDGAASAEDGDRLGSGS